LGQYPLGPAGIIQSQRCLANQRMRKAEVFAEAAQARSARESRGEREQKPCSRSGAVSRLTLGLSRARKNCNCPGSATPIFMVCNRHVFMVCNRHACADHLSMGLKMNDPIPNEEHPGPTCFEEAYISRVSRRHTKCLPPGETEKCSSRAPSHS
jgi:hypothetical protein